MMEAIWVVLLVLIIATCIWKSKEEPLTPEENSKVVDIVLAREETFLYQTTGRREAEPPYNGVPSPTDK